MSFPALGLAFSVGLLSSLHCLGMCGGFTLALSASTPGRSVWGRVAAYHGGRLFTYAFLGALCGAAGASLLGLGAAPQAVAAVAALLLVLVGAELLGLLPSSSRHLGSWLSGFARIARGLLTREGWAAPFTFGLANGFLPCGAVLAMLAAAAGSGSPWRGFVTLVAFGLGTAPALVGLAWFGPRLPRRLGRRAAGLSGVLVVALGLLVLWRGGAVLGVAPECCATP